MRSNSRTREKRIPHSFWFSDLILYVIMCDTLKKNKFSDRSMEVVPTDLSEVILFIVKLHI